MSKISLPDKFNLASTPTPIEFVPFLSTLASKRRPVRIFIKRDDYTHLYASGNKIRKLEYLLFDAVKKGKKVIFTCGGLQSNHARATALLAKMAGLECVLFLRGNSVDGGQGNHLLDRLWVKQIKYITDEQYANIDAVYNESAKEFLKRDGIEPYSIPEGGSNDLGTLGYVSALKEILDQPKTSGVPSSFDSIVCATGSGGTQAGLILGNLVYASELNMKIFGFNISRTPEYLSEKIKSCLFSCIQKNKISTSVFADDINVIGGHVGPGYAKADQEVYDFIKNVAIETGIVLDPVYTAKALLGLIKELNRDGYKKFGENVLFIHTGGIYSIFNHSKELGL
jgi:D-cysteine desulfhydrase